jgi:Domain of unknown function (DUF222)
MCGSGEQPVTPGGMTSNSEGSVPAAVGMALAGLEALAATDLASVPVAAQADCLRELEQIEGLLVAARAAVLSAFDYNLGFKDDGQGTARTWLRWQTRITSAAASGAVGWMRRLRAHRRVAEALVAREISASWAREICEWTDRLPEAARDEADAILLGAATGGAELADLASLAEQMRQRLASPDRDKRTDYDDCQVRLATTLGGVGKLDGDLSPQCAQALQTVLDSLGKKVGPEDDRTIGQRQHDALYEACRRLLGAKCLPDRAGQPVQLQLHISVEDLIRRLGQQIGPDQPELSLPGPIAGPGDECDASIVPIVTGYLDHDLLDRLTAQLAGAGRVGELTADGQPIVRLNRDSVRDLIIANAAALFSGPRGLASWLRRRSLDGAGASVSLPLDVGAVTDTIPAHLRRAVILRDRHCAAPGCLQPPAGCQVHHIRPRRRGGITKLSNLLLLCTFHHLIAVHTWGWSITLNADGTTTMSSPDGTRVYHSHSPPTPTAA